MEKKEIIKLTKKVFFSYYLSMFVFLILVTSCSHELNRTISSSQECSYHEKKNSEDQCVGKEFESIRSHKEVF